VGIDDVPTEEPEETEQVDVEMNLRRYKIILYDLFPDFSLFALCTRESTRLLSTTICFSL
jgi:hypothetical protein